MKLNIAAEDMTFPEGDRQTVGRLLSADGSIIRGLEQIWSGSKGPAIERIGDLKTDHPQRMHMWASVLQHVEGHAAALIRKLGGNQHLVLLVSRDPCNTGPAACETALRRIIPTGSSLTIFTVKPGERPAYYDTYDGNGEALK